MKKIITMTLAMVLFASCFAFVHAEPFPDVPGEHINNEAINVLAEMGIIKGYEDGSFKPDNTVTRAEFVKMLSELAGVGDTYVDGVITGFPDVDAQRTETTETVVTTAPTPDTQNAQDGEAEEDAASSEETGDSATSETTITTVTGHWAAKYIKIAVDQKIIIGYDDGTFRPDNTVKYEEAIKMIVCYLGREELAKSKSEFLGIPLWPDAYLNIGNELLISKNVVCPVGEPAARAMVAQMIYNSKDIDRIVQIGNTVMPIIVTPKKGSGSGGGGGGNISYNSSITGIVVGVTSYSSSGRKNQHLIDENILIDGKPIESLGRYQIIVRTDRAVDGQNYILFENPYNDRTDRSGFLGYKVEVKYRFDATGPVYTIGSVSIRDTDIQVFNASDIDRQRTINNEDTTKKVLVYYDSSGNRKQKSLPSDLNTLTMIYNSKLVDTSNADEQDVITIEDLAPVDGRVTFIDANTDNVIDLVRVESYDTYVVGNINGSSTPKSIDDRFRKDEGGNALKVVIDDRNVNVDLEITDKDNRDLKFENIARGDVLSIANSKCGTYQKIIKTNQPLLNVAVNETQESTLKLANTEYEKSWYYINFVESTVSFEVNDRIKAYLDSYGKIAWVEISPANFSIGYIMEAKYDESSTTPSLQIRLNIGSSEKVYTITKAASLKVDGVNTRTLKQIYDYLEGKAAIINEGKPTLLTNDAKTAQPVRYADNGVTLTAIETLELDMEYKYTNKSKPFHNSAIGASFGNEGDSFSIPSGAKIMFIPNSRMGYGAAVYHMGTKDSFVGSKLIEFEEYNVEPYFVKDADGVKKRTVILIYNESIDDKPNYRSENIIVSDIKQTLSGSETVTTITAYSGTGSSSSYTCLRDAADKAFVLDKNFNRVMVDGKAVTRKVEKGDVIRFGYDPQKKIKNIEIIFDISEKEEEIKAAAVLFTGEFIEPNGNSVNYRKNDLLYYGRVGVITATKDQECTIRLSKSGEEPEIMSSLNLGEAYANRSAFLYDFDPDKAKNPISQIVMPQVYVNDMIYVQMTTNLAIRYIYIVRGAPGTPDSDSAGEQDNIYNMEFQQVTESIYDETATDTYDEEAVHDLEYEDIDTGNTLTAVGNSETVNDNGDEGVDITEAVFGEEIILDFSEEIPEKAVE